MNYGDFDEYVNADGVGVYSTKFTDDPNSLDDVRYVYYLALLAPSVAEAEDLFDEIALEFQADTITHTCSWVTLASCPRADECGLGTETPKGNSETVVTHVLRVRNVVVGVKLEGKGSDGSNIVPLLTAELPFYVGFVTERLPTD
jgi:hypothetical protein